MFLTLVAISSSSIIFYGENPVPGSCTKIAPYVFFSNSEYPVYFQSEIVDKKSVMTYVICMYQVLPHDDDNDEDDASQKSTESKSTPSKTSNATAMGKTPTASPLKVPPKIVTKGRTELTCAELTY